MVEAMSIMNERHVPSVGRLWVESSTTLVPVSLAIAGVADLVGQGCQFTGRGFGLGGDRRNERTHQLKLVALGKIAHRLVTGNEFSSLSGDPSHDRLDVAVE